MALLPSSGGAATRTFSSVSPAHDLAASGAGHDVHPHLDRPIRLPLDRALGHFAPLPRTARAVRASARVVRRPSARPTSTRSSKIAWSRAAARSAGVDDDR